MSDNEATLILRGDSTQLVGEQKKFTEEVERSGNAAKKMDDSFGKTIGKLARAAVIAKSIGDTMKAVVNEVQRLEKERANVSEQGAQGRVSAMRDIQRLGLGASTLESITQGRGTTTEEQRTSFLGSLSEDDDKEDNRKAIQLFNSGLWTTGEIRSAMKDGDLDRLINESPKREGSLGADYQRLEGLQQDRRGLANERYKLTAQQQLHEKQDPVEWAQLTNPKTSGVISGIKQGLGRVPIVGGLLETAGGAAEYVLDDIAYQLSRLVKSSERNANNTDGKLNPNGMTE